MIQNELKINLTNTFSVYRLKRTLNVEVYDTTPTYTGVEAQVTPADNEILALYPDVPAAQLFDCFIFINSLIKNGDKLIDGSEEFIVRGVAFSIDGPLMTYQRLAVQKKI